MAGLTLIRTNKPPFPQVLHCPGKMKDGKFAIVKHFLVAGGCNIRRGGVLKVYCLKQTSAAFQFS